MEYVEAIKTIKYIYDFIEKEYGIYNRINNNFLKNYFKNYKTKKNNYIIHAIDTLKNNNYEPLGLYKEYKSYIGKRNRIKKRIEKMEIEHTWFCTFTIEEKYMKKDHRRKLKELYKDKNFIFNVDYGKKTNRKHYHGIIESIEEPIKWNYGFCKIEKIRNTDKKKLANYIYKLANHTIKIGTEKEKIIYSRKTNKKNKINKY